MEKLNGEMSLHLSDILLRYPCLHTEEVKKLKFETQDGNRVVEIYNPITSLRAWKVFLLCLWKAERYTSYGKRMMSIIVPKKKIKPFLRNEEMTAKGLWTTIEPVSRVHYLVEERKDGKRYGLGFRLLYKLIRYEEEEGNGESGEIELLIDETFYNLCLNSKIFLYTPFLAELHSTFSVNLFMYLTANWNATNFSEHFLFERLGFGKQPEKEKRRTLKRAFQDLQEIGYIKSFAYDSEKKKWIVERYDFATLRATAIEKLKQLIAKEKERYEKLKMKETEKKRRQRKRKQLF